MTEKNNKRDTKEKILNEAKELFAEKGFDNTGINEIAKNVGIAPSVIYYHFENKDDILKSLINSYLEETIKFREKFGEKYLSNPIQDNLRQIIKESADNLYNKELTKIIFMESLKNTGDVVPLFKLWKENINSLFELYHENMSEKIDENRSKFLFKSFLMIGLPQFGYEVFVEQWCNYYNMDREEAKEIFIDSITEYYEKIIKNYLWEV